MIGARGTMLTRGCEEGWLGGLRRRSHFTGNKGTGERGKRRQVREAMPGPGRGEMKPPPPWVGRWTEVKNDSSSLLPGR